jgi:hypothetical protein
MKITNLVEEIFAQAVVLDQNGGLRNTIYAIGREIFIMNYDHTVLLRFRLRATEGEFEHPISFKANDYDSNVFEEKDGKVIFFSKSDEYLRKKTCGTSELSPEEAKKLYRKYSRSVKEERDGVVLNKTVLELLDEKLSHVEFSGEKGESIKMIQRNIYSGGVIEITKANDGLFSEELENDFGPVAIKTGDFKSLFYFQDSLKFSFPHRGKEDFILVQSSDSSKRNFTAIVACCLYDEIIKIQEVITAYENPTKSKEIG